MKKTSSIVLLTLACLALFGHQAVLDARAEGFGITPPYLTNNSLTQNSHYEQTIILVRGNPTEDLKAKVSMSVPGAEDWISIDKGTEFTMPAGTQQMPIIVSVNVPSKAKLGRYTGNIQIVVSPLAPPTKGTVGITIGAQIDVNLQVIDQKMADFKVRRVVMTNTEEGSQFWWMHFPGKILFTMDMENVGNISAAPRKVTFEFREYLTQKVLETETNSNRLATVEPFQSKQVVAEVPTDLPRGSYRVFYQIFGRDDQDVVGQGMLDLGVLPRGTLTAYAGYGFWGIRLSEKLMTFGVIIAVILVLYGAFLLIKRLFRPKKGGRTKGGRDRVLAPPPPPPPHY